MLNAHADPQARCHVTCNLGVLQVQLNDPDATPWVLAFTVPAVLLLVDVSLRRTRSWRGDKPRPPIPAGAWAAAGTLSVMLGATVAVDAVASLRRDGFTMEAFAAEPLREFTGQALVVAWMLVNAVATYFCPVGGAGAPVSLRPWLGAAAVAVPMAIIAAWARWNAAVASGEVEVAPHCSGMISDVQAPPVAAAAVTGT